MNNGRSIFLLMVCLIACGCTQPGEAEQPTNPPQIATEVIDSVVTMAMALHKVPGLSFVLLHDGQVAHQKNYGMADLGSQRQVTDTTLFEAASVSKTVFAYFALKMVDQGVLELDTPLHQYLPLADLADDRAKAITARMVLSHTSGLPNWRFLNESGALDLKFAPGSGFRYSGEGYEYLAQVLAHLHQTDYAGLDSIIHEQVFEPLGMTRTSFRLDANHKRHKASGYEDGMISEGLPADMIAPYFGASFGLHTTAGDFAKFITALMNKEGLTPATFREMFAEQVALPADEPLRVEDGYQGWGLGIIRSTADGRLKLAHGGMNTSFQAYFMILEEERMGFAFFGNSNSAIEMVPDLEDFFIRREAEWLMGKPE